MILIPAALIVGCPYIVALYIDIDSGNYSFREKFNKIENGLLKKDVIQQLGHPDKQSNEFQLGQFQGFEDEYERAEKSNSKYYLFWYRGIDITYAIGFNDKDAVVIMSSGGT